MLQRSFDTLSSFDKINLGSAFLQAAVALSFAAVQHGVSRHFDRPAMRALARLWYLLAIAATINIFSSWSGAVWNNRELSRALTSVVIALLAAGIPYVRLATDALAVVDSPRTSVAKVALGCGLVTFVLHAAGVFGFGAAYPDVRVLAVTWSRGLKLVVVSVPVYIAWRAVATTHQHKRALQFLAIGFTALAVRQVVSVGVGLRVGMPDLPFGVVVATLTIEIVTIMLFGVMSLLANTAEEVSVVQRQAEALMQAKARIASGERLESLGRLAAGVAHDFNNVLHVVRLTTTTLRATVEKEDDRLMLDDVTAATAHGAALVSHLLTFARQQPQDPRPFDAFARLRALTPILQRMAGTGVEFTVTVADATAVIVMDPAQFEQIAINLVANARDAVEGRGRIEVDLGLMTIPAGAGPTAAVPPGTYVRLTVEDNGHGMSADVRSRLFEPFFTTKEADRGSGLGLAMVHGITQRVGGVITVDSTVGKGARFEVYLPARESAHPLTPTHSVVIPHAGRARPAISQSGVPAPH